MIRNGRPYTNENGFVDDRLLTSCPESERLIVLDWIRNNIRPRKTPLRSRTSYGMKHILQSDTGIYLSDNQFKHAMMLSGYEPTDPNELNWHYCISKKSPAFDYRNRRKYGNCNRVR